MWQALSSSIPDNRSSERRTSDPAGFTMCMRKEFTWIVVAKKIRPLSSPIHAPEWRKMNETILPRPIASRFDPSYVSRGVYVVTRFGSGAAVRALHSMHHMESCHGLWRAGCREYARLWICSRSGACFRTGHTFQACGARSYHQSYVHVIRQGGLLCSQASWGNSHTFGVFCPLFFVFLCLGHGSVRRRTIPTMRNSC